MSEPLFSKFKIKKFKKEIEPQEIFLDELAQKKAAELGISEKKLERPLSQRIIRGFWVVFLILILILLGKTFQLQFVRGEEFSGLAEENKFIMGSIQAERGVIYDKNFKQLVFNKASFDLICKEEVTFKDLGHQDLLFFEARIDDFPECEIQDNTVREYLPGDLFFHLIGYQRPNGEKTGLENYYDDVLKSKPGQVQIERDAHGNSIAKEIISLPESGQSLMLWLDADLQEKITISLDEAIKKVGGTGGVAVALDPKTGGVLALVSLPAFDANLFSEVITPGQWQEIKEDPFKPLFNRAISGNGFLIGSSIKPFIGLAALEEGIINADTRIDCPLQICIENPWYPENKDCYRDWTYHGMSDVRRAIAESVNTFFYQVGGGFENFKGLGAVKIKEWMEEFGWGSKTNIDLPQEGKGVLPDLEKGWLFGQTYHISIGQGPFSITPLQLSAAYVAIANKGKIFQPRVVKGIVKNGELVQEMPSLVLKELSVNPENLEVVRQGMRQAVTTPGNPPAILNSLPVAVAAKTGTAQTGKPDVYHNWVTVFAPYEDPQIVLTLMVENAQGEPGGLPPPAVLPVAKEVLDWWFSTP
jgi:penicillin-binding protein 2